MIVIIILLDICFVLMYCWLLYQLLHLTNTEIGRFSPKYLSLVPALFVWWLLGGLYTIGDTINEFFPSLRNFAITFVGLLAVITGIIILEDAIKREKRATNHVNNFANFQKKLQPFVTSEGTIFSGYYKAAYFSFGQTFLVIGFWMCSLCTVLLLPESPIALFFALLAVLVVIMVTALWIIIRWYKLRIYRWAIKSKIIKNQEVPAKYRYIFDKYHRYNRIGD